MESTNGGSMEKHSAPERERVAILDAGAQYGKVRLQYALYVHFLNFQIGRKYSTEC